MHELDQLIMACDAEKCAEFFEGKSEKERKLYAERALLWTEAMFASRSRKMNRNLLSEALRAAAPPTPYEKLLSNTDIPKDYTDASLHAVQAAALSSCSISELKKADCMGLPSPELALRIMLARKPSWLNKWSQYILKEFPATHWTTLNELEKATLCTIDRTPNYWVAMAGSLGRDDQLFEHLSTDDKLLAQLWEMLSEPAVIDILNEPEKYSSGLTRARWLHGSSVWVPSHFYKRVATNRWRDALIKLSEANIIDTRRLIDFSFSNLTHIGEKEYRKGVYSTESTAAFAIDLNKELVKDNFAAHVNHYIALLGAAHKDVSLYALTVLSSQPMNTLSVTEICSCISPVFINKAKEPAEAALKLLGQLAKQFPVARAQLGPPMLCALGHSSKEVNKKALALIESTKLLEDSTLLAEFQQRIDMLGGMERTKAAKLVSKHGSTTHDVATTNDASHIACNEPSAADTRELFSRADALDKSLKLIARVDEAVAAIQNHSYLDAPIALDSMDFPRLNPATAVKPIDNLDDLIYRFTQSWTDRNDPMAQEAVMDGVSRLCNVRPSDFKQKTDSLLQKAIKEEQEFVMGSRIFDYVAARWLGVLPERRPKLRDMTSFTDRRFVAVGARAEAQQAAPLLAAPTHAGGWIDPLVLVQRMNQYRKIQKDAPLEDFVQALLRLAPDNRDTALEAASALPGEMGAALRFALGSDIMKPLTTPEYWVAAYRSRFPKGTSAALSKWLPNAGPDVAEAAEYGLDMQPLTDFNNDRYSSISRGLPDFLPVKKAANSSIAATATTNNPIASIFGAMIKRLESSNQTLSHFPTVILHDNTNRWIANSGTLDWLHNRESLLALLAKRVLQNIDSIGTYWHGDFELIFDPDISLADNGRYLLLFAMSSKNNDLSRLAVDALIAAVAECRLGAVAYGEAMAAVIATGVITPVRWTRGLRDASRTSALHAAFTWQTVSTLLEQAKLTATQQIPFLELLVELQVENGFKPSESLKTVLSSNSGTTKGAKLSQTLISHAQPDKTTALAALQNLEARINRVERWQSWKRDKKIIEISEAALTSS